VQGEVERAEERQSTGEEGRGKGRHQVQGQMKGEKMDGVGTGGEERKKGKG